MKLLFAYFDCENSYDPTISYRGLGECSLNFSTTHDFSVEKTMDDTGIFERPVYKLFCEEKERQLHYQTDREDIRNSAETFHIEELYQNHCDYAKEIINKAKMFSSTQLAEYLAEYRGLFSSKSELYRTIYGNYLEEDSQGRRPLAKLTQDLLLDLSVPLEEK